MILSGCIFSAPQRIFCADAVLPPITNCVEVLKLTSTQADEGRPVRLRGSLTCYVSESSLCFVQDQTAGIYVLPTTWPADLKFGEVIEVQGVTASGRFSPIVNLATLRRTGERGKPTPKRIAIEELNSGRHDSQWVEIEGVVQSAAFSNGVGTLQVWTGGSSATVLVFSNGGTGVTGVTGVTGDAVDVRAGLASVPTGLPDAVVRLQGVAGTFYRDSNLSGFGLFVTGPEHVQVLSPPQDAFAVPLRTAIAPAKFSPEHGLDHRTRIQGIVTVVWPGNAFFVQDDTGAMRVTPLSTELWPHPGDLVEVSGFIRDFTTVPRLESALLRKKASKTVPEAPGLTIKELLSRRPLGQYVATEGITSGVRSSEGGTTSIQIEGTDRMVTALLKGEDLPVLRRGSRLRLTGAWANAPAELRNQLGPVLWLNSRSAVALLAPPKPGSAGSIDHAAWWIVGTLAALLLISIIAVRDHRGLLRLAVENRAGALRLADLERELQRLNDSRERLGRDLHDRIIQSIYAIGLNLDDCAQYTNGDRGRITDRLQAALRDVNGVIAELRNVILGLETSAIQPREFRTALKSLALALGHTESSRVRLDIAEDAQGALTAAQATELIHIAREAMSNSVRHGAAQTMIFGLEARDGKIRFSVADDGRGFALKSAEGKGFGLRNMAKRAENLGAIFSIHSEEGQGTRVVLDIPRQKQHFSFNETHPGIDR